MRLLSALALVGTASRVSAHTPAGAGAGTRTDPVDLGDVTLNSWALTGTLTPGDVKHYKFTINGPTTDTTPEAHRAPYSPAPEFADQPRKCAKSNVV